MKEACDLPTFEMARDAFDVLVRRAKFFHGTCCERVHWQLHYCGVSRKWRVCGLTAIKQVGESSFQGSEAFVESDDPFTAIVEADAWYHKHVENFTPNPSLPPS